MLQHKKKNTAQDLKVSGIWHRKNLKKCLPANVQLTLHQF